MLRAVIGIVVAATFIGALMPAGRVTQEETNTQSAPASEPWFAEEGGSYSSSSSSSSDAASNGEVRLLRHDDGHFYADVEVNGTTVEFLIDTGASGIAMTAADARRVGISLDTSDKTYVGEGAGGPLMGHRVQLDRVELGHRSARDMSGVVIDGGGTNLLGQSFLSRFPEVTVRGDVMTLR